MPGQHLPMRNPDPSRSSESRPVSSAREPRCQGLLVEIVRSSIHQSGLEWRTGPGGCSGVRVEWERLLRVAVEEGVGPTLWNWMHHAQSLHIPRDVRRKMLEYKALLRLRNRWLATELLGVTSLFSGVGVSCLAFKGPTLAQWAYGGLLNRQFSDLDLLVSGDRYEQAINLLQRRGYIIGRRYSYETSLRHIHHDAAIDLHWELAPPFFGVHLDFAALWSRRQVVALHGQPVNTLSREDTVLLLCVQAAKDSWERRVRLINLLDIVMSALNSPDFSGELLGQTARRANALRMLGFGLLAARQAFGLPQFDRLFEEAGLLPDPLAYRAARQACEQADNGAVSAASKRLFLGAEQLPGRLRYLPLIRHELRRVAKSLCNPSARDRRWLPMPPSLSWLHYFVRPVRLGVDLVRRPVEVWNGFVSALFNKDPRES